MSLQCFYCAKRFHNESDLKAHYDEVGFPPSCACGLEFRSRTALDMHHCVGDIRSMAEAHWAYTEKMMHQAYVEAFVHGFGHGKEDERNGK